MTDKGGPGSDRDGRTGSDWLYDQHLMARPGSSVKLPHSPDRRLVIALLWTAAAAGLLHHYGKLPALISLLPIEWRDEHIQLNFRILWVAIHLLFYGVLPRLLASALGVDARALGLQLGSTRSHLWIVAVIVTAAFPVVLLLSRSSEFLNAYPIYRPSRIAALDTILWFGLFAAFLFSIELFFRGFLFALLTPRLGRFSLLVALGPYVATHSFLPEALGAIPVGMLLGILRLRTGSIWPGYLAHLLVALEIEVVALWRHGLLWS